MRFDDVDDPIESRLHVEGEFASTNHHVGWIGILSELEVDTPSPSHDADPSVRVEPARRALGLRQDLGRPLGEVDHPSMLRAHGES